MSQPVKNGPLGLGHPDDKSLRKVEIEVLIPKKMREKARKEKCFDQVKDFNECCKQNGVSLVYNCRKENSSMKECLTYWFRDPDFRNICTNEYLKERSEYRRTGITRKQKEQELISQQNNLGASL